MSSFFIPSFTPFYIIVYLHAYITASSYNISSSFFSEQWKCTDSFSSPTLSLLRMTQPDLYAFSIPCFHLSITTSLYDYILSCLPIRILSCFPVYIATMLHSTLISWFNNWSKSCFVYYGISLFHLSTFSLIYFFPFSFLHIFLFPIDHVTLLQCYLFSGTYFHVYISSYLYTFMATRQPYLITCFPFVLLTWL